MVTQVNQWIFNPKNGLFVDKVYEKNLKKNDVAVVDDDKIL